jgi:hypothetical protein
MDGAIERDRKAARGGVPVAAFFSLSPRKGGEGEEQPLRLQELTDFWQHELVVVGPSPWVKAAPARTTDATEQNNDTRMADLLWMTMRPSGGAAVTIT